MNSPMPDDVIRITREEALGSHVDDLLKRQMSLRGEPGVTREHRRKWYYQNWLVFGVVGMLGAVVAWAILEPYFDDMHYLQGTISAFDPLEAMPTHLNFGAQTLELPVVGLGSITINRQKVYFQQGIREIYRDGSSKRLDLSTVKAGETVGVYTEYVNGTDRDVAYAAFLVRQPPPQSPARAAMTLDQLAARSQVAAFMLFPLVAGLIGLFIGAADGLVCRLPRRALLCGGVGLLAGLVGGFVSSLIADIIYAPATEVSVKLVTSGRIGLSTLGFVIQVVGRGLAWALAGLAMGLGQGLALRSKRLLLYGLIGGIVGGLIGGLLFDPIDLLLLGSDKPSSHWSRLIGLAIIGLGVGGMIGVVELLARDAWLRMTQGPLNGKEFLLFKDTMNLGSSPRSDIYLFNDPMVAEQHAVLRAVGDECEIEARHSTHPVQLNHRTVTRGRLRHGDNVTIGRTSFVFHQRKS